jgi:hypothetical protein
LQLRRPLLGRLFCCGVQPALEPSACPAGLYAPANLQHCLQVVCTAAPRQQASCRCRMWRHAGALPCQHVYDTISSSTCATSAVHSITWVCITYARSLGLSSHRSVQLPCHEKLGACTHCGPFLAAWTAAWRMCACTPAPCQLRRRRRRRPCPGAF